MKSGRRFSPAETLGLGLVFLLALATRAGYLAAAADSGYRSAPIVVQDDPLDMKQYPEFGSRAPLSTGDEPSAHIGRVLGGIAGGDSSFLDCQYRRVE
ncbi:MAG: hypothetical protein HY040_06360 [Planctomycetes bacterium]|nr:hypothetical protein [Planctomycetota bacterium]